MKIIKENNKLFWLIDDNNKKLFNAESLQELIKKLNKTITVKGVKDKK